MVLHFGSAYKPKRVSDKNVGKSYGGRDAQMRVTGNRVAGNQECYLRLNPPQGTFTSGNATYHF